MKEDGEPTNGITSQECAKIIEQEIEGLNDSSQSSPTR